MARLRPFRALRYDTRVVGPLASLLSPPYDVISAEQRRVLESRNPCNFVHLDLPRAAGGASAASEAARLLSDWRARGILRLDERPALTWYEQEFPAPPEFAAGGGAGGPDRFVRRGFLGRLGIDFAGRGEVLPHERTFDKHVTDRMDLARATGAILSPIFVLYADPAGEAASLLERAARGREGAGAPLAEARDDEGTVHRAGIVEDPAALGAAARAIASGPVLIADGHHRYRAARELAESGGSAPAESDPRAWLPAVFVRAEDPGVLVLPTHRIVAADRARLGELEEWLRARFDVRACADPLAAARELPEGCGSFVLVRPGGALEARARSGVNPFSAAGIDPALEGADTALVDETLIGRLLGVDPAAAAVSGAVRYERDAAAAVRAGSADGSAAFLMAATPVSLVFRAVRRGALFPRKSTFFYPKLASGLVVDPLLP